MLSNGREAGGWVQGRERGWEREGLQRILGNGCGPSGTPRLTLILCISLCCSSRSGLAVLNLHMFSRMLVTFLHLGVLHVRLFTTSRWQCRVLRRFYIELGRQTLTQAADSSGGTSVEMLVSL